MNTPARFHGHPFHPMLIVFPIGLWVFSLACQIIQRAGGSEAWGTVALYSMGGGIIGALVAAVPGFVDLFALPKSRARAVGVAHMALNLLIVVLFLIAFFIIRDASRGLVGALTQPVPGSAFALSIILVVLLIVSGWLGGSLVYVHGVAVDDDAGLNKGGAKPAV